MTCLARPQSGRSRMSTGEGKTSASQTILTSANIQKSNIVQSVEPVNDILFAQVLDYGFDPYVAVLAIRRTKGVGVERAVNWLIDHLAAGGSQQAQLVIDGQEIAGPSASMGSSLSATSASADAGSSSSSSSSSTTSLSNATGAVLRAVGKPARAYKMIFVANMSLKMGAGKLAAQVGHATLGVYRQAQRSEDGKKALRKWSSHGEVKIVVKGQSTEQLVELNTQAGRAGLHTYLVQDAGYTQIPPGSRTVLGIFGLVEAVDGITGQLKLL